MSRLGELLEVLHDAGTRARPARLTVVEWTHSTRSAAAFDRFMAERHGRHGAAAVQGASAAGGTPPPDETQRTTTLALESPSRYREEAAGVQTGTRYQVRNGERWVVWDAHWGAVTDETEEGGPPSSSYAFLLDPVALVGAYRLEVTGEVEVAGRGAHRVRAIPRPASDAAAVVVFAVGPGADEMELAVDTERGALLRVEARLGGEPFRRLEVTEIAFGPVPAETFVPTLPPGTVPSGWQRPERLELHELQDVAPFVVLVPARVPDGWRLVESLFTTARAHPPVEAEVSLVYASPDGAYMVVVSERADGGSDRNRHDWVDDGELETADDGANVVPRHHVRARRDGTLVELSGSEPSLLRDLAHALVHAPTDAPRLPP